VIVKFLLACIALACIVAAVMIGAFTIGAARAERPVLDTVSRE
jgi:hypothetical protein